MEIPEVIKKDWKKIEVSKNAVIIILAVGLVLVSAIAVMGSRGEHGGRGEFGERGGMMMGQYKQRGMGNPQATPAQASTTDSTVTAPAPVAPTQ